MFYFGFNKLHLSYKWNIKSNHQLHYFFTMVILFFRDCIITTGVNCFTSFFSGFVIFTYLGFMSHKQGVPISSVATEGKVENYVLYKVLRIPTTTLHSLTLYKRPDQNLKWLNHQGGIPIECKNIILDSHSYGTHCKYT